jgi:hypothetical protein
MQTSADSDPPIHECPSAAGVHTGDNAADRVS